MDIVSDFALRRGIKLSLYCLSVMMIDLAGRNVCFAVNVGQGFNPVLGESVDVFVVEIIRHAVFQGFLDDGVGGTYKPQLVQVQDVTEIFELLLQEKQCLIFHFGDVAVIAVGLSATLGGGVFNELLDGVSLFPADHFSGLPLSKPGIRLPLYGHLDEGFFHSLEGIIKPIFPFQCLFPGERHAKN